MDHQVADEIRFPHITALLTAHGHSPDKAAEIVLLARHKQAPAPFIARSAASGGALPSVSSNKPYKRRLAHSPGLFVQLRQNGFIAEQAIKFTF
jgi:hypothetical protein